jgi:hypothetical protein
MGACELESGDVVPAAIPIRKMTIGIAQTLPLIIDWRIAMPKRTTGDRPELKPVNDGAAAIDIGSRMHMAAVNPCVYRKLKLGCSGCEGRQGWRVI